MWGNSSTPALPKRLDFRLGDFTGGICNTVTENRIKDNEASDLLNVRFEQDGLLKKRNGFAVQKKYSSLLHGFTGDLSAIFVIEPANTNKKGYFLVIGKTDLVYITTGGVVKKTPWHRAVASDIPIDGCQFGDYFFFVDGGVYLNCFKISELESTDGSAHYHYMVRNPGSYTPLASPAVKGEWKEEMYPGSTVAKFRWYEPCALELADGYKGTGSCQDFFATMCTVHKDRLYISGNVGRLSAGKQPQPNMIYISDVMNPFYFPASLPLQAPPTGDKITCLREFNDALIVGRKDDVYAIHGNTNHMDLSDQFTLKRINTHTGIANNRSADTVFNFMFYVGSDGNCYKLSSTSTSEELLATSQVNLKIDFKYPPFFKTIDEIRMCHTAFDPIKGEWHIQIGDDTFIYSYRNLAWVRWKGVKCLQFISTGDEFYYIKKDCSFNIIDENIFYDIDPDNPEIKIPIQFYWISKNIDFGIPSRVKQIRDTFLVSEIIGTHPSDIRIKYEADYVAVTKENNISSEIARWNLAKWDVNRFVYKNIVRSLPIMVGRRCRNFKVFIGNGYEYKGIVNSLPAPQNSEEGQLYYLRNQTPGNNLFTDTIEIGNIDSTTGLNTDSTQHIRSVNYTTVEPNTSYEVSIQCKHSNYILSVLLYDTDNNYLSTKYISYEDGYTFQTTENTAKIRFAYTDPTTLDVLDLQEITYLKLSVYINDQQNNTEFPDGFYLRTKRDTETRLYYKKMYDKDLYQPVKVHEINGIYELRGYR